jgi:Zn-finger nucleic acid-binding protein
MTMFSPLCFADNPVVANCANCGAAMRIDGGVLVCEHCGTEQDPGPGGEYVELGLETTSPCPVCSMPLSTGHIEGCALLCCSRCFGMLIAMDQFVAIVDAARLHEPRSFRRIPPRKQKAGERVIVCPSCRQPMMSHVYGGPGNVVIDTCERCQVNWLDRGELKRIAMAPG